MKEETRAELEKVTAALAVHAELEKTAKEKKDKARARFMELATQAILEERPLRRQTITLKEEPTESWRAREYPDWRIVTVEPHEDDSADWHVVIEEDPNLMKFTFVHPELKKVFGRTTEERGAHLDLTSLRDEIFNLYSTLEDDGEAEVYGLLLEAIKPITTYELDETRAQLVMSVHPEVVPLFQKHAYPGKLSAKLTPIRKAKEEEVG